MNQVPAITKDNKWWRRFYSGAFDLTTVVRNRLIERIQWYIDHDGGAAYFDSDLQDLRRNGRFTVAVARSTQDAFFTVLQEFRIRYHRYPQIMVELGIYPYSKWLDNDWIEKCAPLNNKESK